MIPQSTSNCIPLDEGGFLYIEEDPEGAFNNVKLLRPVKGELKIDKLRVSYIEKSFKGLRNIWINYDLPLKKSLTRTKSIIKSDLT